MSDTRTDTFPADWTEWTARFRQWERDHASDLGRTGYVMPDKNFMADEVLGVWHINGRNVELSAVTFPDLSQPAYRAETRRYVGITYGQASGTEAGPLVSTFAELETALGI